MYYQGNPYGCEWGNMSWGHLTSRDLITWEVQTSPALIPDQSYDAQGVFTGCMVPPRSGAGNQLTVAYSSICKLPFHWSTPPYPRDAAGLAIATSYDAGKSWQKCSENPIVSGEPADMPVTGFRDPFIAPWPAADVLLGHDSGTKLYGLVSGGIQSSGPTTFLYEMQSSDITSWKFIGSLVDLPVNFQPSKKWNGSYGVNWECVNFLSFSTDSKEKNILIIGAEGNIERDQIRSFELPVDVTPRTVRTQVWMSGDLVKNSAGIKFQYQSGGFLDHGAYYAANSFREAKSGRYIVYGWVPEEDITAERARKKGWNGSLALPRELFLLKVPRVVKALHSSLTEITNFEMERRGDGAFDLYTLGIRPIAEFEHFRNLSIKKYQSESSIELPQSSQGRHQWLYSTISATWELEATISVSAGCETVGFCIRHNHDFSVCTTILFSTLLQSITVNREATNVEPDINRCSESGPFTLFTSRRGTENQTGPVDLLQEPLRLRIILDRDVLEVFANDRFALATMVYYSQPDMKLRDITALATGEDGSAVIENVRVWDGLNGGKSAFATD
ncbi:hypothetical protein LTR84_002788 [Exophiala bonariae]|uniref:Glycosyl hydrolase family 32 N-terminal domain-containing protein n=1 Tax=Exophiala bonariae TaxID=1690606 RepID=A0AAV9N8X7_9EURO|nr:hypothetical protein LTR84_002788 [Exophiala bonariae]